MIIINKKEYYNALQELIGLFQEITEDYAELSIIEEAINIEECNIPEVLNEQLLYDKIKNKFFQTEELIQIVSETPIAYDSNNLILPEYITNLNDIFIQITTLSRLIDVIEEVEPFIDEDITEECID